MKKKKGVENGSQMYKHNAESSEEMWKEVGARTRVSGWLIRARLDEGLRIQEED